MTDKPERQRRDELGQPTAGALFFWVVVLGVVGVLGVVIAVLLISAANHWG